MPEKPLCIIPARGGSKRFPRKNLALLAGKPILAYAIEAGLRSEVFDQVCVSSEDDEILATALKYGARTCRREPELATDGVQIRHVCIQLLEQFNKQGTAYEAFAVLLTTNPLRREQDVRNAYKVFRSHDVNYVISLVPFSHPPQRAVWVSGGYVTPYFGLQYMKQTQLLEKLYRHDGSVIFAKTEAFLREQEFYGSKVAPYFIPFECSVDIDNCQDLAWAEFLLSRDVAGIKG